MTHYCKEDYFLIQIRNSQDWEALTFMRYLSTGHCLRFTTINGMDTCASKSIRDKQAIILTQPVVAAHFRQRQQKVVSVLMQSGSMQKKYVEEAKVFSIILAKLLYSSIAKPKKNKIISSMPCDLN